MMTAKHPKPSSSGAVLWHMFKWLFWIFVALQALTYLRNINNAVY
jgi:hypothetical protein